MGMMLPAQNLGNCAENLGFQVGPLRLEGCAMLAPMAGVTDLGMRRIAHRFGASLTVSEMVGRRSWPRGVATSLRAAGEGLDLHVVQIAGCHPDALGRERRGSADGGAVDDRHQHGLPGKKVTGG